MTVAASLERLTKPLRPGTCSSHRASRVSAKPRHDSLGLGLRNVLPRLLLERLQAVPELSPMEARGLVHEGVAVGKLRVHRAVGRAGQRAAGRGCGYDAEHDSPETATDPKGLPAHPSGVPLGTGVPSLLVAVADQEHRPVR